VRRPHEQIRSLREDFRGNRFEQHVVRADAPDPFQFRRPGLGCGDQDRRPHGCPIPSQNLAERKRVDQRQPQLHHHEIRRTHRRRVERRGLPLPRRRPLRQLSLE
jgi:hypothetical protein